MKKTLFYLLFVSVFTCYSQVSFEKGYLINDSNQRIECEIKNSDWQHNPNQFEYRLSKDGKTEIGSLENVKEFAIIGVHKYVREAVNIDVSQYDVNSSQSDKNPVFKTKVLFLKVLLESKASLYSYSKPGNTPKYFYKKENAPVEQLVFKLYKSSYNTVGKNNYFRPTIMERSKM